MSDVREEYTRENYPSFGKKYNGEKAIISLTSWRARINTCSKTIYSLIKQCPGFHIVLVLSEEEFPKMMDELPDNLKLFVDNELIEVLWVYKNYKSFKKVLFTMDKYRDVPVISADDDCIYTCNYAQMFYDEWKKNERAIIVTKDSKNYGCTCHQNGPCTLFPPFYYLTLGIKFLSQKIIERNQDDAYYRILRDKLHLTDFIKVNCYMRDLICFHDEKEPLHGVYKGSYSNITDKIYSDEIDREFTYN